MAKSVTDTCRCRSTSIDSTRHEIWQPQVGGLMKRPRYPLSAVHVCGNPFLCPIVPSLSQRGSTFNRYGLSAPGTTVRNSTRTALCPWGGEAQIGADPAGSCAVQGYLHPKHPFEHGKLGRVYSSTMPLPKPSSSSANRILLQYWYTRSTTRHNRKPCASDTAGEIVHRECVAPTIAATQACQHTSTASPRTTLATSILKKSVPRALPRHWGTMSVEQ